MGGDGDAKQVEFPWAEETGTRCPDLDRTVREYDSASGCNWPLWLSLVQGGLACLRTAGRLRDCQPPWWQCAFAASLAAELAELADREAQRASAWNAEADWMEMAEEVVYEPV